MSPILSHPMPDAGPRRRPNEAFTLVELLTVMAVAVVLIGLVVPALGFKGASDVTKSIWDIEGILEQARAYAMAQNTHVWVGLHQMGSGAGETTPATPTLMLAVVASRDGSGSYAASNLIPVDMVHTFGSTTMSGSAPAYGNRPSGTNVTQLASATAATTFTAYSGGKSYTFNSTVLEMTPQGEALIPTSPAGVVAKWIELDLVPVRGTTQVSTNTAALQISGLTGQIRVFRP